MEKLILKSASVKVLAKDPQSGGPSVQITVPDGSISLYGKCADDFTRRYAQDFNTKTASSPNTWDNVDITLDFGVHSLAAATAAR
jgi:hypothetical protein